MKRVVSLTTLIATTALAVPGLAEAASSIASATAAATWSTGACTGTQAKTGTTIVIDFQKLDGNGGRSQSRIIRCSYGTAGVARTGVKALRDAGLAVDGTAGWGDSFVCRIEGRPSASETLPISTDANYHEQCQNTPPAQAYWGYFYAAPGAKTWTYSPSGAANRTVIQGGYEGWSFSYLATDATNPAPRVTPSASGAAPTVTVVSDDLDQKITLGASVKLSWSSANVGSCTARQSAAGAGSWTTTPKSIGTSGTQVMKPTAKGTYIYTVTCTSSITGWDAPVATTTLTVS